MAKKFFPQKLLVEGKDDQHVVWALCQKFDLLQNFEVIDCEGIDNLLPQIPVLAKQSGIETIGIIIDADTDLETRWSILINILTTMGFEPPLVLPISGLVLKNNGLKIGVWVMPNNNLHGMLEDFIAFLIPPGDQLQNIVSNTLQGLENEGINNYNKHHRSKALIHTWLAWQEDPGTPMGLAITKKYLSTDFDHCKLFIEWLGSMFN